MLLGHPLVLAFLLSTADAYKLDGAYNFAAFKKVLIKGYHGTRHGIMYSIIDSYIYGNVTYSLVCLSYLPIWSLLWTITQAKSTVACNQAK